MRTSIKMGGFGLGLAAVFAATLGLGGALGSAPDLPAAHAGTGDEHGGAARDEHDEAGQHAEGGQPRLPAGLQVTQDGYRLTPLTATLGTGDPQPFRFRITGPDGAPVTRYVRSHDKDLHLIVVRRDLSAFQHVHPVMGADGTWTIPLAVPAAGQYRAFADFQPAGHPAGLTLGVDAAAPGDYRPVPLPTPTRMATVDGYTVRLDGELVPGSDSKLTLSISKDGVPVTDLQPYLGAYGHLVALRDGDLAYLHVHPDGGPGDGRTPAGPRITFYADVPAAGTYRLYLDFRHGGKVRTAEFTADAGAAIPRPAPATPNPSAGHDADGHGHD